jgi:hypothetical protein
MSLLPKRVASIVTVLAITVPSSFSVAQHLYWASDGAINRAPLAGGATQVIVPGLNDPRGVAVDPVAGKVYWAEYGANRIGRANLDGSSAETFVVTNTPAYVTIDPFDRVLFWSQSNDSDLDRVFAINLDGTGQQELATLAKPIHRDLAIHYASGELFLAYCENATNEFSCDISRTMGGALTPDVPEVDVNAWDIDRRARSLAIDQINYRMYWAKPGYSFLSGQILDQEDLSFGFASGFVSYMTIDALGRWLYWSEPENGVIRYYRLSPPGGLFVFKNNLTNVAGLAALPVSDCDINGIEDVCDLSCGPAGGFCDVPGCGSGIDFDGNRRIDACEPDCNANDVPDACDLDCHLLSPTCDPLPCAGFYDCDNNDQIDSCENFVDCNNNDVPDECDTPDCNSNNVPDECDVGSATSLDCNGNGVPDECEIDCNQTGVPDDCDVIAGTSEDCNTNEVPDECEVVLLDCNDNGTPDDCDVTIGTSQDCNANLVPDECLADEGDCNGNLTPDDCDIQSGTSQDADENGIPDECCPPPCTSPAPQPEPAPIRKNRYISFVVPSTQPDTAIRVELNSLYHPNPPPTAGAAPNFMAFEGDYRYINSQPGTLSRCCVPSNGQSAFTCFFSAGRCIGNNAFCSFNSSCTGAGGGTCVLFSSDASCVGLGANTKFKTDLCPDSTAFSQFFRCARLSCTPEYRAWASVLNDDVLHVYGDVVVPSSDYEIVQLPPSCEGIEETCADASPVLHVETAVWGDLDQSGRANAIDVALEVDKIVDAAGAITKPRAQLREAVVNPLQLVSATDLGRCVDAVKGFHYPISFAIAACP